MHHTNLLIAVCVETGHVVFIDSDVSSHQQLPVPLQSVYRYRRLCLNSEAQSKP